MITLYKRHKSGLGLVNLWIADGQLFYEYQISIGGATVTHSEPIVLNNSGRDFREQANLELESRVRRYRQRGYKHSREEAELDTGTNQIGLPLPMLAHPIGRVTDLSGKLFVQRKYDGHRCLIIRGGNDIIAYSRKGTIIPSIAHITNELIKRLPNDVVIDGELYCHGQSLQTIASWVKREQPNSLKLKFHAYDLISMDVFEDRFKELVSFLCLVPVIEPRVLDPLDFIRVQIINEMDK
jgi:DNA ligase-1